MTVLILATITGVELLVLLVVLGWALGRIAESLANTRDQLEDINMGVRAIERETDPLLDEFETLSDRFESLSEVLASLGGRANTLDPP